MMRARTFLACLALVALPAVASAQTSFYGTLSCDEASAQSGAAAGKSTIAGKGATADSGPRRKKGADPKDAPGPVKGTGVKPADATAGNSGNGSGGGADARNAPGLPAVVTRETCSWTLPLLIGNDVSLQAENTFTSNIAGSLSTDTGSHTSHMTNSEQFTMSLSGTSVFDGSEVRSRQGTWTLTGGTGALKGISGSGTYTAVAKAQGGVSYDIEGQYQLPREVPAAPSASPAPSSPATPTSPTAVPPS